MDSKEVLIGSILDDRLDKLVQQPFEKRSDQLTPALKDALILALGDNHDEESMRLKLDKLRKNQFIYKKFEKLKAPQTQIQPKQLTDEQKKYYKNLFIDLNLPEITYEHSRYVDFVEYERLYSLYKEDMQLLYIRAGDVMKYIMEKYQYEDSNGMNQSITIQRSNSLHQEFLDRLYGSSKQQVTMSLRHYIRDRYKYFILPTPDRPYGVHPSYIFNILQQYDHPYFSKKNTFSGIMGEIRGNYCLSGYTDKQQYIQNINTHLEDAIIADMFLKTDDVYKFVRLGNKDKKLGSIADDRVVWLAVDFKVKRFLEESFCKYDSHDPNRDNYETYQHKRGYLLKNHVFKIADSEILCHMESHVNWGTVDGTLFTLQNMKERRYSYVKSFFRSMPYSSMYQKTYIGEYYKQQEAKKSEHIAQKNQLQKNPLYIEIEEYEEISKGL